MILTSCAGFQWVHFNLKTWSHGPALIQQKVQINFRMLLRSLEKYKIISNLKTKWKLLLENKTKLFFMAYLLLLSGASLLHSYIIPGFLTSAVKWKTVLPLMNTWSSFIQNLNWYFTLYSSEIQLQTSCFTFTMLNIPLRTLLCYFVLKSHFSIGYSRCYQRNVVKCC